MPFTESIRRSVARAIDDGQTPGAVVLVGRGDETLYHEAFGQRMLQPETRPMLLDTVFDLASLTKPVATATAVMQLVERGLLGLEDTASRWLPLMPPQITLRHLLTHTSGLPAYRNYPSDWPADLPLAERRPAVVADICGLPLAYRTGAGFVYSCLGYICLASIVEIVSGLPLDAYTAEHLTGPLGLADTGFLPDAARCAATEQYPEQVLCGIVHDENARYLGGVGGNAGLFATAADLARFTALVLNGGELDGERILQAATVQQMTRTQSGLEGALRGLGWDIDSSYSPQLRGSFPPGSFGHSGYTGTSVWADPVSGVFVLILTNRVHLGRDRDVSTLRREIATAVAAGTGIAVEGEACTE